MFKINRIENDSLIQEYGDNYLKYCDGSRYDGELKIIENNDNIREGYGVMKYADEKSSYIGYYKNNLKHGYGKYIYYNGDIYEGNFIDGVKCGKGKFISHNEYGSLIYEGEWKNDMKNGFGKYLYKESNKDIIDNDNIDFYEEDFEGFWINDEKNGIGKLKIKGLWCNDILVSNIKVEKQKNIEEFIEKKINSKYSFNDTSNQCYFNMFPEGEEYTFY